MRYSFYFKSFLRNPILVARKLKSINGTLLVLKLAQDLDKADRRAFHGLDSLKKDKLHNAEFIQYVFIISNMMFLSCHMELAKQHLPKFTGVIL